MATFEEIREALAEENPAALLMDGFEGALVGWVRRCGQPTLAVYDFMKCIEILVSRDGMDEEEAVEFFEFNCVGAWFGEHTPVVMYRPEEP